jgi:hypothetical protein
MPTYYIGRNPQSNGWEAHSTLQSTIDHRLQDTREVRAITAFAALNKMHKEALDAVITANPDLQET